MKLILAILFLAACHNNAITYAHELDPCARCEAINTSYAGVDDDVAVCRTHDEVWLCVVERHGIPDCKMVKKIPEPLVADTCYTRGRE